MTEYVETPRIELLRRIGEQDEENEQLRAEVERLRLVHNQAREDLIEGVRVLRERLIDAEARLEDSEIDRETYARILGEGTQNGLAAAVRARIDQARLARVEKQHGSAKHRCACPGCRKMIPACWVSVLCYECGSENCEHDASAQPAGE